MIQNVNLYLPEFRKKKDWLNAAVMAQVVGGVVVVLVALSAYEYWGLSQLREQALAKEAERQSMVAATQALIQQYGVQSEDLALLENIQNLEDALKEKEGLLQFLEGREQGNAKGFSEYLADLARYHVQGLSLTEVSLHEGGASARLSGAVLRAELVPLYLQNLSKGHSFDGKQFETLQIRDVPADDETGAPPMWLFQVGSIDLAREGQ